MKDAGRNAFARTCLPLNQDGQIAFPDTPQSCSYLLRSLAVPQDR